MEIKVSKFALNFTYLIIFLYIVVGNSLTYNLGNRLPLRLSEILSIFYIIYVLIDLKKISFHKYDFAILFWCLIGFVSAIISLIIFHYRLSNFIYGLIYIVRIVHLIVLVNLIILELGKNNVSMSNVIVYILKCYVVLCFIGFYQLFFYPSAYDWYDVFYSLGTYFANPDPHQGRLVSTYFDPNFLSSCLIIPFAISLKYWFDQYDKKMLFFVLVFAVTIILTVSRTGFLGMVLISVLTFVQYKFTRKDVFRNLIIISIGFLLIIFMFNSNFRIIERILTTSSDYSAYTRLLMWSDGFEIVKQSPIFGIGYNMIGAFSEDVLENKVFDSIGYGNHSSLIVILSSTGVLGFIYAIVSLGKSLFKMYNSSISNASKRMIINIILTMLIICNFNNLLFYVMWLFPFLLVLGCLTQIQKEK